MKKFVAATSTALAAVLMIANPADACRWVYRPARVRLHVAPRVVVRSVSPVVPYSTMYVTPTVSPTIFIGPRGHLHHLPRRTLMTPTIVW